MNDRDIAEATVSAETLANKAKDKLTLNDWVCMYSIQLDYKYIDLFISNIKKKKKKRYV